MVSDKFKFKYLTEDYVKRLQANVSRKVQLENENLSIEKAKTNAIDKTIQTKEINHDKTSLRKSVSFQHGHESISPVQIVATKTEVKLETSQPSNENMTVLKPSIKLKPTEKMVPQNENVCPTPSRQNREFDGETVLAKITSSQRAICSTLNSIVPNLMKKHQFDTPLEAEKCRKRFDNFLKMFTRNYSYPIDLMIDDIESIKTFPAAMLAFKVHSLYNILQVAMATYASNVRNFLDNGVPPKLIDVLNAIRRTTIICMDRMLFDEDDCVVKSILEKVTEVEMNLKQICWSKHDRMKPKSANPPKKPPNTLCMYGTIKIKPKTHPKHQKPPKHKL